MTTVDRKRPAEEFGTLVPVKRGRTYNTVAELSTDASVAPLPAGRLSHLQTPIMLLTGHGGEIFSSKFHPKGEYIASGGFDRQIFLWNTYGDCDNFGVLSGHAGAILQLEFNADGSNLFSASTDKTIGYWDMVTGQRIKRFKGHSGFVNSCDPSRRGDQLLASGSDDTTVKVWDARLKRPVKTFENTYQVTAVAFNDTSEQVFIGGIDNLLKVYDLRRDAVHLTMRGHTDTITGVSLSPDGSYILTNSMDNSLRIYDVRPYAPIERCVKIFTGVQHNFERNLLRCSWSPDGSRVAAGSADQFVYVLDTTSRRILFKLPGHNGSVNEVVFHPQEPILMSCSSDRSIYLGEVV